MNQDLIQKAVLHFLSPRDGLSIEPLGNGLINNTFKVIDYASNQSTVLQAINTNIFKRPDKITANYQQIFEYLNTHKNGINIPAPIQSKEGSLLWIDDENNYWRANSFIDGSYSPMSAVNETAAFTVARSFAYFTRSLAGMDIKKLSEIIPNFHNLSFRFGQFELAISHANLERLQKSTHILSELRQRKKLVEFYESIQFSPAYPTRVMHHDCKISNILFDEKTHQVICPVDLDTTMPGKFFSDLGDMIRSMACNLEENSTRFDEIAIRPSFYESVLQGYLEGAGNIFTEEEKINIHYAGLILVYMQSLRFITDFLNDDIYYKISYPEQNLHRALNQLILLEKLETYLEETYSFTPYPHP